MRARNGEVRAEAQEDRERRHRVNREQRDRETEFQREERRNGRHERLQRRETYEERMRTQPERRNQEELYTREAGEPSGIRAMEVREDKTPPREVFKPVELRSQEEEVDEIEGVISIIRNLSVSDYPQEVPRIPSVEEIMGELREDTVRYINHEDPVERVARLQTVMRWEEEKLMMNTARRIRELVMRSAEQILLGRQLREEERDLARAEEERQNEQEREVEGYRREKERSSKDQTTEDSGADTQIQMEIAETGDVAGKATEPAKKKRGRPPLKTKTGCSPVVGASTKTRRLCQTKLTGKRKTNSKGKGQAGRDKQAATSEMEVEVLDGEAEERQRSN